MNFLIALQESGLATWVRESTSIWAYPSVIFLHAAGLALVVGVSVIIDLSILGFAPGLELAPMEKLFRVMAIGFWVNLVSGVLLALVDAATMLLNPIFWIKMILIGLALVTVFLTKRKVFGDPLLGKRPITAEGKFLAVISLVLWAAAITAGRLTAYLGSNPGLAGL
jgi:hypothetical protein